MTGQAILMRSNAADLPLGSDSVDLIVTSPPYFALRSYQDGGEHYDGQIGAEPNPREFIDALITCTSEMKRVLKPSGSIFVNLGDKYARNGGGGSGSSDGATGRGPRPSSVTQGIPDKSLMGIPWRYALRCIDDLDLILRAEIIWAKPNGLPESVRDRVARKHEQWFHFTKSSRYFSGIDEIRERHARIWDPSKPRGNSTRATLAGDHKNLANGAPHPLGKLPGSVWTIPTEPLVVPDELGIDHYAAFPTEWPRRIITGFAPTGICVECDKPRVPVVEKERDETYRQGSSTVGGTAWHPGSSHQVDRVYRSVATITGYQCACPTPNAPTRPAIVLDPFGGTGTTAAVAKALGRVGITNDLSADYLRLADWRCNGDGYQKIVKKLARNATRIHTATTHISTHDTSSSTIAPTLFDQENA